MSSKGSSSRWRYHISTRLIIISTIGIGTPFFPWCRADDQYDCIMHVYNPSTGKMECSGIVLVDTNADSASDIKAIRLVMIFGFVIFLIILLYHILKHCCTSFGRVRYNYWTDSANSPSAPDPHLMTLSTPTTFAKEMQLPNYPEPPKYNDCVSLNLGSATKETFPGG